MAMTRVARKSPTTQAFIQRAIQGAKAAGLHITSVTITPDGTVTVHCSVKDEKPANAKSMNERSKWEDDPV